ncbi:alpha-L-fucosidase [Kineosporia sp. J2-2]|uniref:alpha-L-fucosidase n=1 Tax=Kineosporia corallincola TaxID=2835133 RepID=A0ABS5TID0_9ACTN|nr:alpha-L-fucosidase [Kineosporia corallincola]MBT0770618.1 alpha-L-fucosidase [Kineosporia corallincola]
MATSHGEPQRPELYRTFEREVPAWYRDAKFGIFVHWGAYSVPAWAEPSGELGTIEQRTWFTHNPYAEWYFNTVRIDGSPARERQDALHGGAPYDDFLDRWTASAWDPRQMAGLFRRCGAGYVVPTTKHHDGITLWDAPGTGTRNTVRRGPRRDIVGEFAEAVREAGLRFGVYYSGGLDWHFHHSGPIVDNASMYASRPVDEAYNEYAFAHVADLIARYAPDVLWGDIEWPDAGKPDGPRSFARLLERYYAAVPDGVVNDRWGLTHWDFRTSEYQHGRDTESDGTMWENCRGIGLSFGYNQTEDASHYLDGPAAVRHLLDVVSRGGNFLLNVGPDEAGRIPELQLSCLEGIAAWMEVNSSLVHGSRPVPWAEPSDGPWVRWTASGAQVNALVDAAGPVVLRAGGLDPASARTVHGVPVEAVAQDGGIAVVVPGSAVPGPVAVVFDRA